MLKIKGIGAQETLRLQLSHSVKTTQFFKVDPSFQKPSTEPGPKIDEQTLSFRPSQPGQSRQRHQVVGRPAAPCCRLTEGIAPHTHRHRRSAAPEPHESLAESSTWPPPSPSPPSGGPCALPSPASREPPSPSPDPQQATRVSMAEPGAPRWPARGAVPDTAPHRVGAAAARFRAGRVQVGAATAEVGLAVGLCGGLVRRRAHSNRALGEKPARACCGRDGAMAKLRPKTITG